MWYCVCDMNPKYKLTEHSINIGDGRKAYRIKALRSFDNNGDPVVEGCLGGYLESAENLSQEGECWVYPNGVVVGNARVLEDAIVGEGECDVIESPVNARIDGNARVCGCAVVAPRGDNVLITGNAVISGDACIYGGTIKGNTIVTDRAVVYGCSLLDGDIKIDDGAQIINRDTKLTGKAYLTGDLKLWSKVRIHDLGAVNYTEGILIIENFYLTQAYLSASRCGFTIYYNKKEKRVISEAFTKSPTLEELKEWSENVRNDKTLKDGISKADAQRLKALYDLLSTQDI